MKLISPPIASSHERAVISCCLWDPEARAYVLEHIEDVDLVDKDARKILKAVRQLDAAGATVNGTEVQRVIQAAGGTVDLVYLTDAEADIPDYWRVADYVAAVKQARVHRELLDGCRETAIRIKNGDGAALSTARTMVERAEAVQQVATAQTLRGHLDEAIEDLRTRRVGGIAGISTGIGALDRVTLGLQPGQLILVAGRPGMGKSVLGLHLAREAAFRQAKSVVLVSLEMGPREIVYRLLAAESEIPHDRVRGNLLNTTERELLAAVADSIGGWDLHIEDAIGWKTGELERRVRGIHRRFGVDLVIVDYLGLIGTEDRHASDNSRVAEISLSLKRLARSMNVPVVALAQLSRECEKRPNKRPVLSDLRDSGSLEQDADLVVFLYRESYYDPMQHDDPSIEVIVAKQRAGQTGLVNCRFYPTVMRFEAA